MLENEIKELKDVLKNEVYPTPPIPLRYIPIWLTTMTFLLTIFLGIATFQSFIKVKEAKDQMKDTKKILEEAERTLKSLKEKYEGEMKQIRDDFNNTSQNVTRLVEEVYIKAENKVNELAARYSRGLYAIEQNQNYLYESIDLLFKLTQTIAESTKNREIYERQYLSRGISQIYSSEKEDRICGINILGSKGRRSDIVHIDFLILNDESDEIKLKASEAKAEILNRG